MKPEEIDLSDKLRKHNITVTLKQLDKIARFKEELFRWSEKLNLLSNRDRHRIDEHILDSLLPLERISIEKKGRWADLGSGNGLPAIPIIILQKDICLDLIESSHKKSIYLKDILKELKITRAKVVEERVEKIGHLSYFRESYDVVISRAFTPLPMLINLAFPLIRKGGFGLFYLSKEAKKLISQCKNLIMELGGNLESVQLTEIDINSRKRYILKLEKINHCPKNFPKKSL